MSTIRITNGAERAIIETTLDSNREALIETLNYAGVQHNNEFGDFYRQSRTYLAAGEPGGRPLRRLAVQRIGSWRRVDLHPCRDSPSPSQRFENPVDGAG